MLHITQLLDKPLIDYSTATCYGIVDNVGITQDGQAILLTDTHCVHTGNIYSVDNAITATNCTVTDCATSLLYKDTYTTKGTWLGKVTDVEMSNTLSIKKIYTPQHQLTISRIVGISDVILTKPLPKPKVSATYTSQQSYPIRYGNCDWIIGKTSTKTITNNHNEVVVHTGDKITQHIVLQCKACYKLRELIANSM